MLEPLTLFATLRTLNFGETLEKLWRLIIRKSYLATIIVTLISLSACEALQGLQLNNNPSGEENFSDGRHDQERYRFPKNPEENSGNQNNSNKTQSPAAAPQILKADIYQKHKANRNDSGSNHASVRTIVSESRNTVINPAKIEVTLVERKPVVSGGSITSYVDAYYFSTTASNGKKQFDLDNMDIVARSYGNTAFGPVVDFEEVNTPSESNERIYHINLFALKLTGFQDSFLRISNIRFAGGKGRIKSFRLLPGDSALLKNKATRELSFGDNFIEIRHVTAPGEYDYFITPEPKTIATNHPHQAALSPGVSNHSSPQDFRNHFSETYEVIVE